MIESTAFDSFRYYGDIKDYQWDRCGRAGKISTSRSWYCDKCHVEVYERRCPHCGKLERDDPSYAPSPSPTIAALYVGKEGSP